MTAATGQGPRRVRTEAKEAVSLLSWRPVSFVAYTYQTKLAGQSMSALPGCFSNLFCYRQGVIHFNTEVSDGAFDLGVAE